MDGTAGIAPAHCLSIDVEEHFQVTAFESPMRRRHWDQFESRVRSNTDRVLDLLGRKGIKATFFILGWVAERSPRVVQMIVKEGHEVASHGFGHELITAQTTKQFRQDVRKTKQTLEDLTGQPVYGYRAPSFSINAETIWALSILAEEGYQYDSSMFPVQHAPTGVRYANSRVHRIETVGGDLWEVPPSTATLGRMRIPVAGGGYLRQFPFGFYSWLLRRAAAQGHPLVMYLHPWELDPEQPRMAGSWVSRLRHYRNLAHTEERLTRILETYRFGTIRDVLFGGDSAFRLDPRRRTASEQLANREVA
jgi:polysaccharide deacetylase family protein (PEP-CTERM system associated)